LDRIKKIQQVRRSSSFGREIDEKIFLAKERKIQIEDEDHQRLKKSLEKIDKSVKISQKTKQ
jgi:hypothetical protein